MIWNEWHHGYGGLLLMLVGWLAERRWRWERWPRWVWWTGAVLVIDDVIQHSVSVLLGREWHGPLHILYGVVYANSELIRSVNAWLDGLFR